MKNKHLLFAVTLVFMTGLTAFSQVNSSVSPELTGDGDRVVKKLDPMNAANWISARRVNQYTGTIDLADILRAQEQVKALQRKGGNSLDISWTEMGPNNIGGRTRALLIDKDNTSVLFAGGVSGGLWKSTTSGSSWEKVATTTGDLFANMAISAIAQTANGDIYFGTGEGMASSFGSNQNEHNGVMGQGIWKSTDHGNTFERLTSTWSTPESMATFVMVNDLSADPTDGNRLYAATANGVMMTTDGGASWVNPIPEATDSACDVQAGPDGTVIACVGGIAYLSPNGDPGTFVQISEPKGVENGKIDDKDVVRMKFAFAPSDPNYIYCLAVGTSFSGSNVTGHPLSNVYQSTDKGQTWKVIGPGGSNYFQPISNTGDFSVAMAVDPSNPDFIMLGGRNLFSWSYVTGWEMITIDEPTQLVNRGFYVHRDQHVIAFDPANTDNIYVGTSGGIAVTNDKGLTWRTLNRNYNVTQFLTVAYSPTGELLGGTVDNGILYIDFQGNDPMYAQWWGGNIFSSFLQFRDGGDCEISTLDPSFKFYTTPGGTIHRRMIIEDQISYQTYYGTGGGGAWLSPMCLWESYNDPLSWDTVLFIADRDYAAGETIVAESLIKKYPLTYTLEEPLAIGDTVKVQDTYQASLAFGKGGKASVKMNRHPLSGKDKYRNQTYTILDRNTRIGANDNTIEVEFSSDAYYLFAATWDDSDQHYKIYRVSNLQNARDRSTTDTYTGFDPITGEITYVEVTEEIGHFDQVVTSLRVDPTNNDNVIATLGNYGNESNIYLCTTATTAADSSMAFVSIQGNLPQAPVYDVLFNWRDHKEVIVATEYGVYSTSDVFANPVVWASENHNGMEIVPVFQLRQQKFENSAEFGVENHGVIYAATYGRGLFKSETFATKGGASSVRTIDLNNLKVAVTPNPVNDIGTIRFELAHPGNVDFLIYDMQGKLVKSIRLNNQPAGQHESTFDSRELGAGTYLIRMNAEGHQKAAKFMIK